MKLRSLHSISFGYFKYEASKIATIFVTWAQILSNIHCAHVCSHIDVHLLTLFGIKENQHFVGMFSEIENSRSCRQLISYHINIQHALNSFKRIFCQHLSVKPTSVCLKQHSLTLNDFIKISFQIELMSTRNKHKRPTSFSSHLACAFRHANQIDFLIYLFC